MQRRSQRLTLPPLKRSRVRLRNLLYIAIPGLIVLGLTAWVSLPIAGILFAALFLVLAFLNPPFALMITFASASFIADMPLGRFQLSFGEISLVLIVPVTLLRILYERRLPDMGPLAIPAILYVAVCIFSTSLHWEDSAINAILQTIIYLFAAVIVFSSTVSNPLDLFPAFELSLIVGSVLAVSALATNYSFPSFHKNAWGAIMSTLVVVAVELWFASTNRRRKLFLIAAIMLMGTVLFFSLSRGGWLGMIAGVLTLILLRRQFKLAWRLALILVPLIGVLWFCTPQAEKDYAIGFEKERGNIAGRLNTIEYCTDTFLANPVLGVGVALRKEIDATNIVLVTLAETGVVGFAFFLWLHAAFFHSIWKYQKVIPRTHPLYSILAIGAALVMRCLAHGMVDHYWSRGPILQAWGAAGMTICAVRALRKPRARPRRAKDDFVFPKQYLPGNGAAGSAGSRL